uniref:8-oxo-dGTP diphosphatase MutT n=1 Tax=Ningiella ruwaisensis TaxID=2364274 RepID=UPI00109FA288|nr:8-oxo-dGTP diphosphatase MutT [Ningiella ruwaisensis]
MKYIDVAVGVIYRNRHFFICKRNAEQHQGNKWEFPGGKVDAGESPEQALQRELEEEVAIQTTDFETLINLEFEYPDKQVRLHVFLVKDFNGTAKGAEGQEAGWVSAEHLANYDFPEANVLILDKLREVNLID